MTQSKIDFYVSHTVKSISSDNEYTVTLGDEGWECTCPHGKYGKNKESFCRHIQSVLLDQLREKIQYLTSRTKAPSKAFFSSVDEVSNYFIFSNNYEFNMISWAILFLAKSEGEVSADSIQDLFGEKFANDPRIIGSAFQNLKKKKYIEFIRYQKSVRRTCHNRPIGIFSLTEDGGRLF